MRPAERACLDQLLARSTDPRLHDVVWDHIEGKITRRELYRDPCFAREMSTWYAEEIADARRQGFDPAVVGALVAEVREDEDPVPATVSGVAARLAALRRGLDEARADE